MVTLMKFLVILWLIAFVNSYCIGSYDNGDNCKKRGIYAPQQNFGYHPS